MPFFIELYLIDVSIFVLLRSSYTSHKKNCETLKLTNFRFFLSCTFKYKLISNKLSMNANIKKTQVCHKIKYDLKLVLHNGVWGESSSKCVLIDLLDLLIKFAISFIIRI